MIRSPATVACFDLLDEECLAWRDQEQTTRRHADNGIKVDTCPNEGAVVDVEKDKGRRGEGEHELSYQPCEDIVVTFVGSGFSAIGCKEERAQEATGV